MIRPGSGFYSRLLRALAAFGVIDKQPDGKFALTSVGRQFLPDQPEPLRDFVLFFCSPDRFGAIQHFPDIVSEGGPEGYTWEYGHGIYEHCDRNPAFAEHFNAFQTLTSIPETAMVLETFEEYDFTPFSTVCDVGGGHGEFLASVLDAHPHLEGQYSTSRTSWRTRKAFGHRSWVSRTDVATSRATCSKAPPPLTPTS